MPILSKINYRSCQQNKLVSHLDSFSSDTISRNRFAIWHLSTEQIYSTCWAFQCHKYMKITTNSIRKLKRTVIGSHDEVSTLTENTCKVCDEKHARGTDCDSSQQSDYVNLYIITKDVVPTCRNKVLLQQLFSMSEQPESQREIEFLDSVLRTLETKWSPNLKTSSDD